MPVSVMDQLLLKARSYYCEERILRNVLKVFGTMFGRVITMCRGDYQSSDVEDFSAMHGFPQERLSYVNNETYAKQKSTIDCHESP